MPGDPALPARAWDFPPWQAARLVSGAAQEAARAWTQRVPAAVILDVTWDLQRAFRDLGITLWRLSRFQHVAGPDGSPRAGLHEPGSHIYRAGSATMDAGVVLRDREVLEHVRLIPVQVSETDQTAGGGGHQQRAQRRVEGGVGDVEQPGGGRGVGQVGQEIRDWRLAPELMLDVGHGWYSVRSLLRASWTLRLAASWLVPMTAAISS